MKKVKHKPAAGAKPDVRSAWRKVRLPAITLAGVLTAVSLVSQFFEGTPKVMAGAFSTIDTAKRLFGWTPPAPYEISVRSLSVLPRSLMNVMASRETLHWLWVGAENRKTEPLHLTVEVSFIGGPAIASGPIKAGGFTVVPGKKRELSVHLPIPFGKSDFSGNEVLRVAWLVSDDKQHVLWQNTVDIPVLPREIVPWGLQSAKGEEISRDFLVASLVAWTITPEPAIEERARKILATVPAGSNEQVRQREWMRQVYDTLFTGPEAVKVSDKAQRFPPKTREPVKTPAGVLSNRRATALEATLLLAAHRMALGGELRPRLTMLAMPAQAGDREAKDFLLGWSADGHEWEAIDLKRAATTAFEPNHAAATARARPVLEDPKVVAGLAEGGVFVDDTQRLVALNFRRAQKFYNIRPLP